MAPTVDASDFVTQSEAAEMLGIPLAGVGWRLACGHLDPAEDETRRMGVTRGSLQRELTWQAEATRWERARRRLGNVLQWF